LTQALAGDQQALARLLFTNSGRLTKRISRRLESSPPADFGVEDVLQEVFVDVLRGIGTFRTDDGTPFEAWLDRVADNRLFGMLRRCGRKKRGGEFRRKQQASANSSSVCDIVAALASHRGCGASSMVHRADMVQAVHRELADLPDAQRNAIASCLLDEHSLDSTADRMQTTPGAVRGLLHRGKQALRKALGNSSIWFHHK
jgi:RNA polymerase sigma-70 factor (ECF subfamily)